MENETETVSKDERGRDTVMDGLRKWLQANKGQWAALARKYNIPYNTLEKVGRGTTRDPRWTTVQALLTAQVNEEQDEDQETSWDQQPSENQDGRSL